LQSFYRQAKAFKKNPISLRKQFKILSNNENCTNK